jgi:hypothetical protein
MNFFTMGTPLVGGTGSAYRGRRTRDGRYDPYYLPAMGVDMPKCQAQILKPKKSLLDSSASEGYDQCRAPAIKDDILCSVHRKQTDLAVANDGYRASGKGTFVSVPEEAFKKSRFRLETLNKAKEQKDAGSKASFDATRKTHEIWDPRTINTAAILLVK